MNAIRYFCGFVKAPEKNTKKKTKLSSYPEILQNPIYGNHRFIQLPGVKLHYVENGPKDKELLLFVHGFPDFWFSWKNQIKEFSKDYWVVAVDMRGYGESEKSMKTSFYKIDLMVDDIKNLVLKLGRNKFTLIAHDWGGVIAHYFIRIHPEMLNKYILINTVFHPKLRSSIFSNTKQFFKSWYIFMMQIPYYPEYLFTTCNLKKLDLLYQNILEAEELEAYKYTFGSYDKIKGPINYYRANFKLLRPFVAPKADKLNKMNVFGLYIYGENDLALTLNISYHKSFEDIKDIVCVTIPNAGHFVHISNWETVNKICRIFLDKTK